MSMKIQVGAEFDGEAVKQLLQQFQQQMNSMGKQIATANKVKFEPVSKASLEDMRRMVQQFEALKRVHSGLNKRINDTGQKGKGFLELDWNQMYPDAASRHRQMAKTYQYVTGQQFQGHPQATGGAGRNSSGFGTGAGRAIQAGLNAANGATGGVSGVASGALGTGMQAGFGAGLAGLVGGIVALGVSKIVGAVTEKIDQAEKNLVDMDKLKRVVGDVGVSFKALNGAVQAASDNIHVTYAEGGKLASQFAKLGNLTAEQIKSIGGELETGGGMSRAFGLDPSQGIGFMGQMRGARLTQDEQGSRKMALIIGETIAKSNAFAKADEVMDAISSYATAQARSSLGANVGGYAGALTGLTRSGIPGLDIGGSAALLNRVNASLSSGGAMGEASQFFSASIGAKHGLDPYQLQMWREGGAFSTLDSTFGEGSVAKKFGMSGPGGNTTWMQASLDELRKKYGHNKGMLANATANHLGVSMPQAMAMLQFQPEKIGEMQQRLGSGFDLKTINASSIGTLGKIMGGDRGTVGTVAGELMSRTGSDKLTGEERDRLTAAMSSGSLDEQKNVLMRLVATREQEATQGKDIHDSKVALDNIKTLMAEKLIPLTQGIRDGILYMAGGKSKSRVQVMQDMEKLESDVRVGRIKGDGEAQKSLIDEEFKRKFEEVLLDPNNKGHISKQDWWKQGQAKLADPALPADEKAKVREDMLKRAHGMYRQGPMLLDNTAADRVAEADKARREAKAAVDKDTAGKLAAEDARRAKSFRDIEAADRAAGELPSGAALKDMKVKSKRDNAAAFLDTIGTVEGAGWNTIVGGSKFSSFDKHPGIVGLRTADGPSTAAGKFQITKTTWDRVAKKLGLGDFSPESQERAAIELIKEKGAWEDVLNGDWESANRKLGGVWQGLPTGRSRNQPRSSQHKFDTSLQRHLRRHQGTPMPEDGTASRGGQQKVIFGLDPLEVIHKNERGEQIMPTQMLGGRMKGTSPFGTESFA